MLGWIIAIVFTLFICPAGAQTPDATAPKASASTENAATDHLDRLTPFGCVRGFLLAANRGDYAQAAEYLDVLTTPARSQELARQLEALINYERSWRLDHLARKPEGDLEDHLSKNRDRAGHIETASGKLDIYLDRVQRRDSPQIWLFSSETVKAVPKAYEEIGSPLVARFVPPPLLTVNFLSIPLWRWLAIIVGIPLAVVLASLVSRALSPLLRHAIFRITREDNNDNERLLPLSGPLRLIFFAVALRIFGGSSDSLLKRQFWADLSAIFVVIGLAWLIIELSDFMSYLTSRRLLRRGATGKLAIVSLARRVFNIVVVIAVGIILLHRAGVNVTAMLAGVGVGGIALALAAQKTLENFFGGISVIMREAIRVGDFCKIADQTGTIEDVGLGSTSVRTLDRTLVSVPNAQIAQMNLENMSMRDKFWFHHVLGLRRDTSPEQMRSVLNGIDKMLQSHLNIEKETARIQLIAFGSSSLDIEVFAYVNETKFESFLRIQQDLLLGIIDIVAASGTALSLPSQTTYLQDQTRAARETGSSPKESADSASGQGKDRVHAAPGSRV